VHGLRVPVQPFDFIPDLIAHVSGDLRKATLALWVHYLGLPLTSSTRPSNMFDKLSKKSPKPPQRHIFMGIIPSNTLVGPLGFRAEVATDAESEQSRPHRDLEANGLIRLWC